MTPTSEPAPRPTASSRAPSGPVDPDPLPRGLVLLRGAREEIDEWVARAVVPLVVVPAGRWRLAVLSGPTSVAPPYDDGALLLAGRPVTPKAGPSLGFFEIDGRAVITVQGAARRRTPAWVVWEPDVGLLRPPGLDLAGPAELVRVAGAAGSVRDELVDLLHETRSRPVTMLQAVLATLDLPGARLLGDPRLAAGMDGAVRHEPQGREVLRFEDSVADSVRLRRELGALP
ncbi:hypothetical protein [Ornithinimicrobium tianjinense]|uniref:Uncharacterized protein n=1 Tax=Ornithinimicrobium tianjinense TaxID=1195761 RepID=A0A917BLF7_9MICO|nr:hypothetical protein [Ornithinimicrobium tianjinense]GGF48849.1 hypothetical protein GCM10011366_15870 [Ornithinimicrobium tianjinense]